MRMKNHPIRFRAHFHQLGASLPYQLSIGALKGVKRLSSFATSRWLWRLWYRDNQIRLVVLFATKIAVLLGLVLQVHISCYKRCPCCANALIHLLDLFATWSFLCSELYPWCFISIIVGFALKTHVFFPLVICFTCLLFSCKQSKHSFLWEISGQFSFHSLSVFLFNMPAQLWLSTVTSVFHRNMHFPAGVP